jgi:hypothetical protein
MVIFEWKEVTPAKPGAEGRVYRGGPNALQRKKGLQQAHLQAGDKPSPSPFPNGLVKKADPRGQD